MFIVCARVAPLAAGQASVRDLFWWQDHQRPLMADPFAVWESDLDNIAPVDPAASGQQVKTRRVGCTKGHLGMSIPTNLRNRLVSAAVGAMRRNLALEPLNLRCKDFGKAFRGRL